MKLLGRIVWIFLLFGFILLGITLRMVPGFRFSSLLSFGCAGLILFYWLLRLLKKHRPKTGKILLRITTIFLCIGLVAAFITGCFIATAGKGNPNTPCAYMIVLGAGVNGTTPSMILSERIQGAYTYLSDHPDVICVVSGGQGPGEDITEAQCMFDHLTAKGIEPERIWLEDRSTSTRENIRFSLELIESKTGSRPTHAAILSNEFHLFRAGLFANEQGLEAVGIPSSTRWTALRVNYFLREIFAVWYLLILGG